MTRKQCFSSENDADPDKSQHIINESSVDYIPKDIDVIDADQEPFLPQKPQSSGL